MHSFLNALGWYDPWHSQYWLVESQGHFFDGMPWRSGAGMCMARATKAELELRVGEAADMLAQGHSSTVVTTHEAEKYQLSRRQARRITAAAYELIVQDLEGVDLSRPQMTAKLIVNLEQAMQKALLHNQSAGLAACAKQIINLCGLSADSTYNSRGRRTF